MIPILMSRLSPHSPSLKKERKFSMALPNQVHPWKTFSPKPCRSHVYTTKCLSFEQSQSPRIASSPSSSTAKLSSPTAAESVEERKKTCLRCGTLYCDRDNSSTACSFHGHTTGERGLFAMAPPHQGIDGEWTDKSGVIVYKWNEKDNRPNTGRANWKKRWTCCGEYDENAPPCRRGWHVSYDDGYTLH